MGLTFSDLYSMLFSTLATLSDFRHEANLTGKTIAWTNGCFDILHPGHLETFRYAKSKADYLIVGLNADNSPYFSTKPGRPINDEPFRIAMLEALRYVDGIFVFSEETPIEAIRALKPDVLIKGGDYKLEEVVGYKEVTENGGMVETVPIIGGHSSTNVIEKIVKKYG